MASNDLIGRIREGYSGYTKAEKKVANYILENTKECIIHVYYRFSRCL